MIFLIALALRIDQCEGPAKTPAPVPNGRLLFAEVIFRHGARTPGANFTNVEETGEWYCDDPRAISPRYWAHPILHPRNYHEKFDPKVMPYPPSCRQQDLILQGMQQHYDLGQMYRKYFIESRDSFLSLNYSPYEIFARSTNVDRAIRSLISFIQGLYPPASPNEIVQLMTDSDSAELLDASDGFCSELKTEKKDFEESEIFKTFFTEFSKKYQEKYGSYVDNWTGSKVKKFASYVLMVKCTNHTLPSTFTQEFIDDCAKYMAFYHYNLHNNDKYRGVGSAPIYREIIRMADDFISQKSSRKLVLIGSHDTELAAMLVTLGYINLDAPPQLRSHFLFELWEVERNIYARICFNGEEVPISFLNNLTLYPYSQFKSELYRTGMLSHCYIPEWQQY